MRPAGATAASGYKSMSAAADEAEEPRLNACSAAARRLRRERRRLPRLSALADVSLEDRSAAEAAPSADRARLPDVWVKNRDRIILHVS